MCTIANSHSKISRHLRYLPVHHTRLTVSAPLGSSRSLQSMNMYVPYLVPPCPCSKDLYIKGLWNFLAFSLFLLRRTELCPMAAVGTQLFSNLFSDNVPLSHWDHLREGLSTYEPLFHMFQERTCIVKMILPCHVLVPIYRITTPGFVIFTSSDL